MIGIGALISSLLGMLGGSLPKFFELATKRMDFKQEMAVREYEMRMRKQEHEMQLALAEKNASAKIEESYFDAMKAELQANTESMVRMAMSMEKPSGYWWIDAINASLRPMFFLTTMMLFFIVITQVVVSTPEALATQAAAQFWLAVEGVVGWVCGYRSVVKRKDQWV